MSDLAYKISVMQAALEGKKIEVKSRSHSQAPWNYQTNISWNWFDYEYRLEPEVQKPREFFVRRDPASCGCHMVRESVTASEAPHYMRVREVIE